MGANFVAKELNVFIRSLGPRLGHPYTEYEVHLGKQQRIPSQVQHDQTNDDIPEVICGVWLKYLLPVTLKGGSTEPPRPPLATGMPFVEKSEN